MTVTNEQKTAIIYKYVIEGMSSRQVANLFNINKTTVLNILKQNNIKHRNSNKRKYTLNEHYFDIIDTEDKAYFLGLLYADGCNDSINHSRVILNLQEDDIELLQKFNEKIDSNRPISINNTKNKYPTHKNMARLTINSRHVCDKLSSLGCVNNKTFNLQFPTEEQVPSYLIRHFLRGFWDGDGSLSSQQGFVVKCKASAIGTYHICNSIKNYIKNLLNIHMTLYTPKIHKESCIRTISISGAQQTYKFLKWLYSDCDIFLKRKMCKFLDIQERMILSGQIQL